MANDENTIIIIDQNRQSEFLDEDSDDSSDDVIYQNRMGEIFIVDNDDIESIDKYFMLVVNQFDNYDEIIEFFDQIYHLMSKFKKNVKEIKIEKYIILLKFIFKYKIKKLVNTSKLFLEYISLYKQVMNKNYQYVEDKQRDELLFLPAKIRQLQITILEHTDNYIFYYIDSLKKADKDIVKNKKGKDLKKIIGDAYEAHRKRIWEKFDFTVEGNNPEYVAKYNGAYDIDQFILYDGKLIALEEDKGHAIDSPGLAHVMTDMAKTIDRYQNYKTSDIIWEKGILTTRDITWEKGQHEKELKMPIKSKNWNRFTNPNEFLYKGQIPYIIINTFANFNSKGNYEKKRDGTIKIMLPRIQHELKQKLKYMAMAKLGGYNTASKGWFQKEEGINNCYSKYVDHKKIIEDIKEIIKIIPDKNYKKRILNKLDIYKNEYNNLKRIFEDIFLKKKDESHDIYELTWVEIVNHYENKINKIITNARLLDKSDSFINREPFRDEISVDEVKLNKLIYKINKSILLFSENDDFIKEQIKYVIPNWEDTTKGRAGKPPTNQDLKDYLNKLGVKGKFWGEKKQWLKDRINQRHLEMENETTKEPITTDITVVHTAVVDKEEDQDDEEEHDSWFDSDQSDDDDFPIP
tara:strand:+ start:541 stop:2439 length:1899 start_codon:yes stop_codon:yes gene_type:complete